MAQLPAANYLSDSARTEAEMQTALESLRDVIAEIGSQNPRTLDITSGELEAPTSHFAWCRSEGHASGADDVLDTIDTAGIDQGRLLILRNFDPTSSETANTERITINHGTGVKQMELSDSTSFLLCGERMIAFVYSGTRWIELWRSYHRRNAEDIVAERSYLGLGDASTETVATSAGSSANDKVLKVGSSANLTANDLLAIDSSGNIVTGTATGGNADTLDNYDSSAFLRKADTATNTIAANLNISTAGASRFIANTTGTSQEPGLLIQDNGTTRASLTYAQANGGLHLRTEDASGTMTPSIRLNAVNDRLEFITGAGASWQSLRPGPGNGLNADMLDGSHLADILGLFAIDFAGGSFRLHDGTNTLLVQWPGTFTSSGFGTSARERWTFDTSYTSTPIVIGGVIRIARDTDTALNHETTASSYTVTTTYIEHPGDYNINDDDVDYRRIGTPIVIGPI